MTATQLTTSLLSLTLVPALACGGGLDGYPAEAQSQRLSSDSSTSLISNSNITAYSYDALPSGGYTEEDAILEVTTDPGNVNGHQRFYAMQFFGPGQGGYLGIQDWGCLNAACTAPQKVALFSIWGSTACAHGTGGACVYFNESGTGYSAHIPFAWSANTKYRLKVYKGAYPNWNANIENLSTGVTTGIGTLAVPSTALLTNNPDFFTEYFGPDFSTCASIGKSVVDFWPPTGDDGKYTASWQANNVPSGGCQSYRSSVGSDPNVQTVGE